TGEGVRMRLRPSGASGRVTTAAISWAAARVRRVGTAASGVPAKTRRMGSPLFRAVFRAVFRAGMRGARLLRALDRGYRGEVRAGCEHSALCRVDGAPPR